MQKPPRSTPSHRLATPRGHGAPHSPTRLPGRSHTASAAHADAQTHLRPAMTRATSQAGGGQTQPTQVLQRVLRDDDSDASRSDGEEEGEETGAAGGASSEESEGVETAVLPQARMTCSIRPSSSFSSSPLCV